MWSDGGPMTEDGERISARLLTADGSSTSPVGHLGDNGQCPLNVQI